MKSTSRLAISLFLLFLVTKIATGQQPNPFKISEIGTPEINTFSALEYNAHEQNFGIDQADNGLMYVANNSRVIQFDGKTWSRNLDESGDAYFDVATGPNGLVFGLSKSEYGYWYPNERGIHTYQSLVPKTPESFHDIGGLHSVDILGNKVIFRANLQLLSYDIEEDTVVVIDAETSFGIPNVIHGKYFVADGSRGLAQLDNNRLVQLPTHPGFAAISIAEILSFSEESLLLVTQNSGLFVYDFNTLEKLETDVSEYLEKANIRAAVNIGDQYVALGSDRSGVIIIDKAGKLVQKLNKSTGLHDSPVEDLYLDQESNLWAAQNGAISHIILNSPFTNIDERHGLTSFATYLFEHQNKLYAGIGDAIMYKDLSQPWQTLKDEMPFQKIRGFDGARAWMFLSNGPDLFALTSHGLGQIVNNRHIPLFEGERIWAGVSLRNKEQLIGGSRSGYLHLFSKENGKWIHKTQIKGFNNQMDFLEEAEDGDIWMTDSGTGVFKIKLNQAKDSVIAIKTYDADDGLPDLADNRVFRHKEGLVFTTASGIYAYDASIDRFEPIKAYNDLVGEYFMTRFAQLSNGSIITTIDANRLVMLKKEGEQFSFVTSPYESISNHTPEYITSLNSDKGYVVGPGVKYIDPSIKVRKQEGIKSFVRNVRITNKEDSLLFGGNGTQSQAVIKTNENALRFHYSVAFYDGLDKVEYQSYLVGSEETWAGWTAESTRDYTNLPHGTYTFKVRAKDHYGRISDMAEFNFTILTPWYLTWWAYVLYAIITVLIIRLIVKVNLRRVEKEKEVLEQTVAERTEEIRLQKDEIEEQANRLRELDKVKSRFFANISHELRTPLTLINAPLESLVHNGKIEDPEVRKTLETATRNGVSLLSLVEEILDLAKLDGGKLQLVENPVRINDFMTLILGDYKSGLEHKSIKLKYEYNLKADMAMLMDEGRCTKVINNLLSNAMKFTPEGGEISVLVTEDTASNRLKIEVSDTGIGIHPNDLSYVFDRYYQSEQPGKKAEGGTGIGLALAKELAELHGGSLTVTSEINKGTSFVFELPIKEVFEETIVTLSKVEDKELGKALNVTIERYNERFEVDRPVLLVTEDHPEMRAFIAQTLSPYFEIRQAENGKVALDILNSERVDIVISDVMMPIMDGFELLEQIKKTEALHQVSLIMLTARADHDDKLYALTLGIDDYLTKPFSASEFLARIKNILENRIKIIRELSGKSSKVELLELAKKFDLVEREVEVLNLLAKRYSNPQIADALFISRNTVKFHIKNIYGKMGIKTREEAVNRIEPLVE